jgi:nucleoside-diphosphate kinase
MKDYALIIMKPDALERGLVETIVKQFIDSGFQLEMVGFKTVEAELILSHYQEVIEKLGDWFKTMVLKDFVGKAMIPIILSQDSENAIANARALTGATDPAGAAPGTIRGDYGQDSMVAANDESRSCFNLIHCSDSQEAFETEAKLWFDPQIARLFMRQA